MIFCKFFSWCKYKIFCPVVVISVENSPNSKVVKSVVFSSKNALSVVVSVMSSEN